MSRGNLNTKPPQRTHAEALVLFEANLKLVPWCIREAFGADASRSYRVRQLGGFDEVRQRGLWWLWRCCLLYDGSTTFSTYAVHCILLQIKYNEQMDQYNNHVLPIDFDGDGQVGAWQIDPDADTLLEVRTRERDDRLAAAMRHLPKIDQTILRLHFWEGYSFKTIGLLLDRTGSRIQQVKDRALLKLQKLLKRDICHV